MPEPLHVLIIEDRPADAEVAVYELRQAGFAPNWRRVDTLPDFLAELSPELDVILADYTLPQFDALQSLRLLQERGLDIPFIIVTGSLSEEVAVDCLKQGATDYLLKDRLTRLGPAVTRALEQKRLRQEKRRAEAELRDSEQRFRLLAESASDLISRHAPDSLYLYVSPACRTLLGYAPEELVGRPAAAICHPEDRPKLLQAFALLQKTSAPCTLAYRVCHQDGKAIWFETTCRTVRDSSPAAPLEIHAISRDVSERKHAEQALQTSLKAKEVLLKELQHRVKNNLQVVSSLLGLQSVHVKDEQARRLFKESQDRVKSIALVHEKCYHSPDLERIVFADYIRALVLNLFHSYGVDSGRITFQLRADDIRLNLDTAIPCALIINELVSNSLKHAFPSSGLGTISVDLRSDADGRLRLAVRDNGFGLPHGVDIRNTKSLGLQLVSALTDQLNGTLERRNGEGTTFTITFNELSYKKRS